MTQRRIIDVDISDRADGLVPAWSVADSTHVYVSPSTGGGVDSGTSFPGGPSTGDLFFRTDRGRLYFYDGTRWLTVQEFDLRMVPLDALWPISATGGSGYAPVDEGENGAWVTRLVAFSLVVGTNNGSNFWTAQLRSKAPGGTTHNIGSTFNTSADTAGNNTKHTVAIGAAVTSGDARYEWNASKTGSPSNLYLDGTVYYRLIG